MSMSMSKSFNPFTSSGNLTKEIASFNNRGEAKQSGLANGYAGASQYGAGKGASKMDDVYEDDFEDVEEYDDAKFADEFKTNKNTVPRGFGKK